MYLKRYCMSVCHQVSPGSLTACIGYRQTRFAAVSDLLVLEVVVVVVVVMTSAVRTSRKELMRSCGGTGLRA